MMSKASEKPPTISVVMSVFNGGEFLARAIQSILDQTFSRFEFIIIDDGSTDDTVKTIKSFNDPRIKLIRQKNMGLVAALNKGVKEARGEFIARMDADDISLPSRFEKALMTITADHSIGMVGSFYTFIDLEDRPFYTQVSPYLHQDLRLMLLHTNPFGHGSTLIRKTALKQAGLYSDDYHAAEDYDLWCRMAPHWRLAQVPESLYWYRINPESISATKKEIQSKSTARVNQRAWKEIIPTIPAFDIARHYRYYKHSDSPHSRQVTMKYIDCLLHVWLGSVIRHKPRTFLKVSIGLSLTSPFIVCRMIVIISAKFAKKTFIALGLYNR